MEKIQYFDEDRFKHMSWCLKNDIKIYYNVLSWAHGNIVISDKGVETPSVEEYRADNKPYRGKDKHKKIWSERIFELYTIKYLEYNE